MPDETLTDPTPQPVGLDLELTEQILKITWADGLANEIPAVVLRKHCPCAACRTEREKQTRTLLPVLSGPPAGDVRLVGGHVVGNYAIQPEWSDGHSTGIFDFKLLRALHAQTT